MLKAIKINKAPQKPGVYFFQNRKGKIIYIGKAKNMKARLLSYLRTGELFLSKQKMSEETEKISWQETESNVDALILEAKLIKEKQPKYNVMLRDDKKYFYVAVTEDKFPKIFITHQPTKIKNSKLKIQNFIGPFTDGVSLKSTLKTLRRLFPYCACKTPHKKICQSAQLGLCPGICCRLALGEPDEKPYRKNLKVIIEILTGKRKTLLKKLEKEMTSEAKKENFEKATKIREEIFGLKRIFEHQKTIEKETAVENEKALAELKKIIGPPAQTSLKKIPERIECYDISNFGGKNAVGSMAVFGQEGPRKSEYKKFLIKTKQAGDIAMLKEMLERRFKHKEWPRPDLVLIDGGKAQLNVAKAALSNFQTKIMALAKRNEELYLEDGRMIKLENLPLELSNFLKQIRNEAHRFALNYHQLKRKRDLFSKN